MKKHMIRIDDVNFFNPKLEVKAARLCCPACGEIIGGRSKWEVPPFTSFVENAFDEPVTVYLAEVQCFCSTCQSWYTQLEIVSTDAESLSAYLEKIY